MPLLVRKHGDISMQVVAAGCIGLGESDSWFRMAPAQGIWTFISKDLATPRKKSFSSFYHSVTINVRLSPASLQTQHRLLLPNSLTHAPSVPFPPRSGSEDGKHQPPPEKQPRVHADADLNQNASVFPSLIFCHSKRATLSPASASPSSVAYLSATIITFFYSSSPMSPPPFPVLCFWPYA